MKRAVVPLFVLAALVFPISVQGAVNQYAGLTCTSLWNSFGNPRPFVCLTESINFSGDKLILTGSSDIPDLRFQSHGLGGLCSPKVIDDDNWNDCISSVWAKLGTSDSICLYDDNQYNERYWSAAAPTSGGPTFTYSSANVPGNDAISSVMLQQSGSPCSFLYP